MHQNRPLIMWPTMIRAALLHAANGGTPFIVNNASQGLQESLAKTVPHMVD